MGTGISAAYVSDPANVNRDPNYIRRVTFNVGRVAQITATALLLAQPLPGGAPTAGAGVQQVVAFVDREGGSFFQEWSALFVAEEESGGRVCLHYPHLSPTTVLPTTAVPTASPASAHANTATTQMQSAASVSKTSHMRIFPLRCERPAKPFNGRRWFCWRLRLWRWDCARHF